MKIAHFVYVSPHRSGLYETTRDLCAAEIELGHDAKLVDTSWIDQNTPAPNTFRLDRGVDVATVEWAESADVYILHSRIPQELYGKKPTVLVLHGAPEYVFYSELFNHEKGDGGYSTLLHYKAESIVNHFITFWPRHVEYWKAVLGDDAVSCVPAPVKMDEYTPEGTKSVFSRSGEINIGYCDTWRPTFFKDPFQILAGVRRYWKRDPRIVLQMFGVPSVQKRTKDWGGVWDRHILAMKRQGDFFGDLYELQDDMASMYRGLDLVVTSSVDASRIVRESLCCGTPLVAPYGNPYSDYTCDMSNPDSIAEALQELITDLSNDAETVRGNCLMKSKQFNSETSATEFVKVLESVMEGSACPVES